MPDSIWAIVVAGGDGRRFGRLKQFEPLGDLLVFEWSLGAARAVADEVVLVVPSECLDDARVRASGAHVVAGGKSRADSVRAGLAELPANIDIAIVHDAARPLASPALFHAVVDAVRAGADGAIPGLKVADTIKRVHDGAVVETLERDALVAVQTPQAFRTDVLRRAHATGADATDDAALVEALGKRVVIVEGERENLKLTEESDLLTLRDALVARTR